MDVIAGRKTTGLIEFDSNIFVNGRPKDDTFEHLTGYVEQNDLHNGQATVKEALEFSAHLRLPASVDAHTREAFIQEVMELVGLTTIQNRMIGDASQPSLSTGQLKLLTIAVELVANPSIIFLDEPTSGLDSKSAYRVMRAIKRIAATQEKQLVEHEEHFL
jgi:ABC-type multidrug transport system ATPase subunit